jgi:hypothetical protein
MTNLALLALVQRCLKPDTAVRSLGENQFGGWFVHNANAGGGGATGGQVNTAAELLERVNRRLFAHQGVVLFGVLEAGMGEVMSKFAVVGEEHEPLGVEVEATYGKDATHAFRQKRGHRAVVARVAADVADDASRLVHLDVDMAVGDAQGLAVDEYLVGGWVHLDAHFADDAAVDLDVTVEDHLLAGAAAANAGCGHDFVESFFGHGFSRQEGK